MTAFSVRSSPFVVHNGMRFIICWMLCLSASIWADINSIEVYAAELEAKLEVIEDKDLAKAIDVLANLFGIEVKSRKVADKAETRKAMGLKPKA